jgi:hypothetical protein
MVGKQLFVCFVSWLPGYLSKNEMLPAEFSTAHSTKTSLLHHIMHLDILPDHPKSSIGCIKINCNGLEAIVCVFCQLVAWITV